MTTTPSTSFLTTAEIAEAFLAYFKQQGHTIVESSPLVPHNDPTLLFTNAGMVQFKDVFLGADQRPYSRAATAQRCLRAGGKHNDLDNVGYTARHHTFFEMLGNFSFGDYFKKEAIRYAWEFLTVVLKLPKERLWITVYEDDAEAESIWFNDIGIDQTRFSRCGSKDNFWAMGDTGPCGPCSEIFYDHGPEIAGGPPGSPDADGDRYIEIWNLVFMQFDRQPDGTLLPLPRPCVDTGMGLERITAVMQHVHSNYEIDLFTHLRKAIAELAHVPHALTPSLCVVADHLRATSFLIADGVLPSNEGRGYVLRRIIRRAARHGQSLGLKEPFLHQLVPALIEVMGQRYPTIKTHASSIQDALRQEETQFAATLELGLKLFEKALSELKGQTVIPGDVVFKLYDTHGFPVDLTADLARERQLSLDEAGFQKALEHQRAQSQAASSFKMSHQEQPNVDHCTPFEGYDHLSVNTNVHAIFQGSESLSLLQPGQEGWIVLESTPFYAQSGGQVGDQGILFAAGIRFEVRDTLKIQNTILHQGILKEGTLKVGQSLTAQVDAPRRQATALNHSATHLLHAALRELLGNTVQQKGSLVDAERLRFDFSHAKPLTGEQIIAIEQLVNQHIRANHLVHTVITSPEQAMAEGAMALFGERYGEEVRFLTMGDFSKELCGGTHAQRTGDIGVFKILQESGIAAGIRRIEAITGATALDYWHQQQKQQQTCAELLKTDWSSCEEKITQLIQKNQQIEKDYKKLHQKMIQSGVGVKTHSLSNTQLFIHLLEEADVKTLRETLDHYRSKQEAWSAVALSAQNSKIQFVVGAHASSKIGALQIAQHLAQAFNGKAGGKAEFAQGGGSYESPEELARVMEELPTWIASQPS